MKTNKISLILYNDDINSMGHVINTLMKYCNHSIMQAEQCALLAHLKGYSEIKRSEMNEIISISKQLSDNNLNTKIKSLN